MRFSISFVYIRNKKYRRRYNLVYQFLDVNFFLEGFKTLAQSSSMKKVLLKVIHKYLYPIYCSYYKHKNIINAVDSFTYSFTDF